MSASELRLFDVDANGLMHQIPPADTAARREGRVVRQVNMVCHILLTDEELAEAQKAAEEHAAMLAAQNAVSARRRQPEPTVEP